MELEIVQQVLEHPVVRGALTGWASAAAIDFAAFKKWESVEEAARYGWRLAAWRWFQGAVVGAVAALGIEGLI